MKRLALIALAASAALCAAPVSAQSPGGIAPVVGSLVDGLQLCTGPCNVTDVSLVTAATAGYYYVFNTATSPADGAVVAGRASGNYQDCGPVAATTRFRSSSEPPETYTVGARLVFSTTACGTLTKNATAVFLKGRATR